ncbi:hypothetical protein BGX34_002044 [Mortierella sp. NVP85]|nr:hypothetical protein BGX34_002044 [Mortierella sp. NVP85]
MHSAWQTPELIGLIARFLTQREVANCMATCRLLHTQFEQHRWRRFCVPYSKESDLALEAFRTRPTEAEARAIMRNRHHLRSVSVNVFAHLFLKNLCVDEIPRPLSGSLPIGSVQFKPTASSPPRITLPALASTAAPFTALSLPGKDATQSSFSNKTPLLSDSSVVLYPVTKLRKLHVDICQLAKDSRWRALDTTPTTTWVLRLLDTNPLITDLHLPASILVYQWAIESLLNMIINQLPLLEHLTFGKNHLLNVPFEHCPPLLHGLCKHQKLRELHCLFNTTYSNYNHAKYFEVPPRTFVEPSCPPKYFEIPPQRLLTEPSMSLRAVTLPRSDQNVPLAMVLRFLNNCVPFLEDLEVPEFVQPTVLEPLEMLGSSTLQHLRFEHAPHIDPLVSKAALLACKNLKSIRVGFWYDVEFILTCLAQTRTRSLEVINVHDTGFFSSSLVLHFLKEGGAGLQEFSMSRNMQKSGLTFDHVMRGGPWLCLGLRILRLIVCRSVLRPGVGGSDVANSSTKSIPSLLEEGVTMLYQQIGRLAQLEVLDLRYARLNQRDPYEEDYMDDLTFSGGLPFLSELKSLRQLVLISNLWTAMGQCEIEFMADNWPRLEMIAFGTDAKLQDWSSPDFDHWRWLQKQRRGLRLEFLECNDQEVRMPWREDGP